MLRRSIAEDDREVNDRDYAKALIGMATLPGKIKSLEKDKTREAWLYYEIKISETKKALVKAMMVVSRELQEGAFGKAIKELSGIMQASFGKLSDRIGNIEDRLRVLESQVGNNIPDESKDTGVSGGGDSGAYEGEYEAPVEGGYYLEASGEGGFPPPY